MAKADYQELDIAAIKAKSKDVAGLPDLYALERVEDKSLWTLAFVKDKAHIEYISAAEASTILADVFEVSVDEAAVRMALTRAGNKVHTKDFGRTKKFSMMKPGREHLEQAVNGSAIIVDPQKPHTSIQRLSNLFNGFTGIVKICDPYLDRKTLEVTPMISDKCDVRLLSNPPKEGPAFLRHFKAYRIEHPNLEIRSIPAGQIHDRYLITATDMWSIGHSLNAIGSKQSFVIKAGEDVRREIERFFDSLWATATVVA